VASLNRVLLIGNVGRDCVCKYTASGQAVANFSVATSETYGGRDGAERQERTEWHEVILWARQAEIAAQYVRKGRQVYVEGRLQTRDWVDPQGVKQFRTEVICSRFLLLGKRDDAPQGEHGYPGPAVLVDGDYESLGPPLDGGEV